MIINVTDLRDRKMNYVSFSIKFKNGFDKKVAIKGRCNTRIPLYDDIVSYLLGHEEDGICETPEDVAEILFVDDPSISDFTSRLFDEFTTVFISSDETSVEVTTLFDVLLHITSNGYSSFVLYDNEDREITETPRFVISK